MFCAILAFLKSPFVSVLARCMMALGPALITALDEFYG